MVAGVMSDPARNSPPPMTDESVLSGLDKDQRAVAVDVAGPLAVLAGAGTGKTRAITHRIAHAVLSGAQAPDSILAVTFTTRAAGRCGPGWRRWGAPGPGAHLPLGRAAPDPLFLAEGDRPGLPEIAGSTFGLVAEAARRHHVRTDTAVIRDLSSEISWAKSTNVLPAEYAAMAERAGHQVSGVTPQPWPRWPPTMSGSRPNAR